MLVAKKLECLHNTGMNQSIESCQQGRRGKNTLGYEPFIDTAVEAEHLVAK